MARWNAINRLRLDMDMIQAKVKWLHKRGCDAATIAEKVGSSEKAVRVIIKYITKKSSDTKPLLKTIKQ